MFGCALAGARIRKWNLALLDVQTRETFVSPQVVADLSLPSRRVPGTNLLASRVSYDLNKNLRVGTIFTNGDPAVLRQNWTSPKGKVQLDLGMENDCGRLPTGNVVQRLWSVRTAYAWNLNLLLSSFIQHDTASENVGTNTRLRWTIQPGNDLFIVWSRGGRGSTPILTSASFHRAISSP